MPKKNLSRASLDANSFVAPDVSAAISEAANAITSRDAPAIRSILTNLIDWDRLQAEAEGANLKAGIAKDVAESAPRQSRSQEQNRSTHSHANSQPHVPRYRGYQKFDSRWHPED